ncbi:TerB N-terminal domain-containing protein [Sutterella wadsworthensis]|uniref:TerB N-terminal domain-containing protein n=1 Tax=Sutterella wadsworthensis TaxID=40545 RepID=UPI0039672AC5
MSEIYADEVIPPRAADSRGQNKTNAEDAGSDWDFLELNGNAAAERSSAVHGDGSITLKSSRDEAFRRQRAHFREAPDTPSPTVSQKKEPAAGDRAFREVLGRLKEAQQRAAADGAAAGGVFRAMGMAAADYEDVSGLRQRFLAFCPAYDMMTQGQLRTYFAWRTDVRRAMAAAQPIPRPVSSSYAVLYLMELVNGIGTSGPEESCQTAQHFWEAYRRFDFTIDRLAMSWLQDLADYWGLVGEQMSQNQWAPSNAPNDQHLRALIDCQAALGDDLAVGGLLFTLSDYAPEKNAFFKLTRASQPSKQEGMDEERLTKVFRLAGAAWRQWVQDVPRSQRLKMLGCAAGVRRRLFQNGLFDMTQAPDRSVVTADGRTLIFSDGLCFEERIAESRTSRMMFLAFLKQAENMLRRHTPGFKPVKHLADPSVVQAFETVAAKEAEARRRAANPARKIDFTRLRDIRTDAEVNRDRLVLAEEIAESALHDDQAAYEEPHPTQAVQCLSARQSEMHDGSLAEDSSALRRTDNKTAPEPAMPAPPPPRFEPESVPLSGALNVPPAGECLTPELQKALAELLHHGRTDCAGLSPAMFVDRINELLFDAVGDAVLEMTPAGPAVIEDYIDDVKRIIL